ncbi:hypothetical protein K469DRAFT_157698 [Zopfia rhizophila CBS 207.26]|uniref:Uncharacterized protein n=1 Tax=Zopfia rhizophila CBS 207.26 TaxID=1314779 RepID=A0A6A6E7M7_9PEZI|nr:hypothetical protein K469DRAFT_157698 [Zopfia rhizophila CBS 207.26]
MRISDSMQVDSFLRSHACISSIAYHFKFADPERPLHEGMDSTTRSHLPIYVQRQRNSIDRFATEVFSTIIAFKGSHHTPCAQRRSLQSRRVSRAFATKFKVFSLCIFQIISILPARERKAHHTDAKLIHPLNGADTGWKIGQKSHTQNLPLFLPCARHIWGGRTT